MSVSDLCKFLKIKSKKHLTKSRRHDIIQNVVSAAEVSCMRIS